MGLNNMGLGFQLTAKDDASAAMLALGKNVGLLKREAEDTNRAFEGLTGRTRDLTTGRFTKGATSIFDTEHLKKVGGELTHVGKVMIGVGAAGIAALAYASVKAAEFGKAIALVATEADLAVFPQQQMADVAQKLAVQFGRAPVAEANALYKAVALGANDAVKATNLLTGANLLAVAGNADLELTMNALGGALNAYGADMNKATDYSDALFVAMKNGNTTVQDLAGAIGRVTSSAANLNIPIEEVLGAVSVMTNKGVQAAEAVSGLKEALANVVHPSADAAAEAARLGIKFTQAELRAKGLQGFLAEITSSTKFTSESFSKLFTSVEGANAVVQIASGNMASFNNVMTEMGKKTGATAAGFEIMTNTLDFQAQRFSALKDNALILIGDAIKPLAAQLVKAANAVLTFFAKIPKPVIAFGVALLAAASAASVVVGAVVGLVGGIMGLIAAKAVLLPALAAVAAVLGVIAVAAGPLILLSTAIYVAWTKDLGGIATKVTGWLHNMALGFESLVSLLQTGKMSGAVWQELGKSGAGIQGFVLTAYAWLSRIKNFFVSVWEGFNNVLEDAQPTFTKLSAAISALGRAFDKLFGGANNPAANAASFDKFGEAGSRVGEILGDIITYATTGITWVTDFVTALVNGLVPYKQGFADVGNSLVNIANLLLTTIQSGQDLANVFGGGDSGYSGTMNSLGLSLKSVADSLKLVEMAFKPVISAMQHAADLADKLTRYKNFLMGDSTALRMQSSVATHSRGMGGADVAPDTFTPQQLAAGVMYGESSTPATVTPVTPGGAPNPGGTLTAPGVAQAQGENANTAAVLAALGSRNNAPQPVDFNNRTTIVVDGAVLAELVEKHKTAGAARGLNPTQSPV